jgi:hypothetical protein
MLSTTIFNTPEHAQRPSTNIHTKPVFPADANAAYSTLNTEDLLHICCLTGQLLQTRGVQLQLPPPPLPPQLLDPCDNAKYEQIACASLKPRYNGSAKELIPTLNLFHIRRQNETWYPATILKLQDGTSVDLVQQFSKVQTETLEAKAKEI